MAEPRRALRAIALAFWLVPLVAAAQSRDFEADFDDERKPWKEIEAQLPPYPRDENLIRFDPGEAASHRYYVDEKSLTIGEDGVVRYTLVMKTAGGAVNVSFEGIRCETREQKYYATGRAGGTWSRARNPQWRRIERRELNRHHNVLYADFLCERGMPARSAAASIAALKAGRSLRPTVEGE